MLRILLFVLVTLLLAVACASFFIVDQTEFAVQMRFGRPVRVIVEPGPYARLPWPIDTVVRFDNRLRVLENPAADQPDKEYLTQDEQSGIGKNVIATTYTCWRVRRDPDAVRRFLETMGDVTAAEARIGDVVVSELGAALGRNDFAVLINTDEAERRWTELLGQIRTNTAARVEQAYGVEIVDIRIQRLNFPEQNRRNVFDRMRAERETIAARYRSEGEERATTIRADASRSRAEILARALEEAERIRGQADAEAARIYAEAYGADPEFYRFVRTLEAYEKTLNQGTVAILSGSSEFLRLLNRAADQPLTGPETVPDGPEEIAE